MPKPPPTYKWLTRDQYLSEYRAEQLKRSGYCLWMCRPELDGWWIPKEDAKNNAFCNVTEDEAKVLEMVAGRALSPGEIVKVRVPTDNYPGRQVRCQMEPRADIQH